MRCRMDLDKRTKILWTILIIAILTIAVIVAFYAFKIYSIHLNEREIYHTYNADIDSVKPFQNSNYSKTYTCVIMSESYDCIAYANVWKNNAYPAALPGELPGKINSQAVPAIADI